jgi:hypothetical protein
LDVLRIGRILYPDRGQLGLSTGATSLIEAIDQDMNSNTTETAKIRTVALFYSILWLKPKVKNR